jgi:hypothetical protein
VLERDEEAHTKVRQYDYVILATFGARPPIRTSGFCVLAATGEGADLNVHCELHHASSDPVASPGQRRNP